MKKRSFLASVCLEILLNLIITRAPSTTSGPPPSRREVFSRISFRLFYGLNFVNSFKQTPIYRAPHRRVIACGTRSCHPIFRRRAAPANSDLSVSSPSGECARYKFNIVGATIGRPRAFNERPYRVYIIPIAILRRQSEQIYL